MALILLQDMTICFSDVLKKLEKNEDKMKKERIQTRVVCILNVCINIILSRHHLQYILTCCDTIVCKKPYVKNTSYFPGEREGEGEG